MFNRNQTLCGSLILAAVLGLLSSSALAEKATLPERTPAVAFHPRGIPGFVVQRDDVLVGLFAGVDGIGSESEVIEFREGGDDGIVRKIPGRTRYPDITLKRGITSNLDIWDWREEVVRGELRRSTVLVTLVGARGRILAQWEFINAWPSKISGPQLDADGNDIAIETLTLSHEGITRTQ